MRTQHLLFAGAVAVVAAGCASEESSPAATGSIVTLPPVTTATSETTTTTEPAPTTIDTTTTIAPTTTAPPTTEPPPATDAPPATEPAPSGPVAVEVPILAGGEGGGWPSLGSWTGSAWAPSFTEVGDPIPPAVAPGQKVTITGLQAGADSGVLGSFAEACFDGRTGPVVDAPVGSPEPPGFGYSAVALPSTWALQPRPVAVVDADIPAYSAAGQAVFADDPVDATLGNIEQIVLADLDGDGDEEALVSFEYVQDSVLGAPGDLATLMLVDTATGAASTVFSAFVPPDDGDDLTFEIIQQFRTLAVADLNGDGRMEVVVHSWYYEGAAAIAFEYDGAVLTEVLSTGCGA